MASPRVEDLQSLIEAAHQPGNPLDIAALAALSGRIAQHFTVSPDEVAILAVTPDTRFLHFLLPVELQNIGEIPINSNSSLAARTARERRPDRSNNFTSLRHSTVFEGVPIASGRRDPIQKIMSAPILEANHVLGVIQVSRKGESPNEAGDDFSPADLSDLTTIANWLAPCLRLYKSNSQ